ncbi:aromatic ring-hydroxylating oxygenase subunit alpha [Actinomadura rudentiformis]|uniref:Aromatic ring-hydroxylating dioxygenase subunit alpha n=1 Tax=Actinomadura rudentiformis TaxID=359158 RepID=A0A6H9Y8F5_9ACTN|nr:aromatic ring-hydroxylating dioxygenase subunit alpha [Actinomadura rudentiformis]KAB2340378.1 aromatic ring-hydroxylating dioxygenase subunit alpha [Actinomadura rudentiformis]
MTTPQEPGSARCPGPSVQDYLDRDSRPVPAVLRYEANDFLGSEDIDVERFVSPEWARLEQERLWRRVWQFACLEDEIPEVGDHVVYEIGTDSILIVRTEPGEHGQDIRAFVNVCLHRGRKLRTEGGNVPEFRCPFHGFTWNLDGSLKNLPCAWDFPHVELEKFTLPEVRVDTWRGFVFINMDPAAEPLADFLGTFPEYFVWPLEDRYKALHIAKVLPCNWKVAQDAFIESFHVIATHPQLLPWLADANSQYDATADQPNWSRMINIQGAPSPHVAGTVTEQDVLETFYFSRSFYAASQGRDLQAADGEIPQVPEGGTARAVLADQMRTQLAAATGRDYSATSDSELLDAVHHLVFPNFHPWGGVKSNIVYRFRPDGLDPDSCIAEIIYMSAYPPDGPKPEPAKIRWVPDDALFADIPELGLVGPVFDQDVENLPHVQTGLKSLRKPGITLSNYQESRVRHFNRTLDTWMER